MNETAAKDGVTRIARAPFVCVLALIVGCISIDPTENEYMRRCEAEGMLRVEQTPIPQSSILFRGNFDIDSDGGDFTATLSYSGCTNCVHLLTDGLFDFVEAEMPAPGLVGEQPDDQILVPDRIFQDVRLTAPNQRYYVKFSLAAEGDPQCDKLEPRVKTQFGIPPKRCLRVEHIERPNSAYSYLILRDHVAIDDGGSVYKIQKQVRRSSDDSLIMSADSFNSLFAGTLDGKRGSSMGCRKDGDNIPWERLSKAIAIQGPRP
jgi:hypothetical protein